MSLATQGLLLGFGASGSVVDPPDEPTLAMVDNANGTATATITGSTTGTTNTLYSFPVGGGAKTSRGSRTGDGTIVPTLTGAYYWQVKSADGDGCAAWSNTVFLRVTSGTLSIYEQILNKVQTEILDLGLTGLGADDVVAQLAPEQVQGLAKPYILICPFGQERHEATARQPMQRDDIQYPVLISFIDNGNRDHATNRSRWLLWRELISKKFRNQPMQLTSQQANPVRVEYRDAVDINAWFRTNTAIGGIQLRCFVRETRG